MEAILLVTVVMPRPDLSRPAQSPSSQSPSSVTHPPIRRKQADPSLLAYLLTYLPAWLLAGYPSKHSSWIPSSLDSRLSNKQTPCFPPYVLNHPRWCPERKVDSRQCPASPHPDAREVSSRPSGACVETDQTNKRNSNHRSLARGMGRGRKRETRTGWDIVEAGPESEAEGRAPTRGAGGRGMADGRTDGCVARGGRRIHAKAQFWFWFWLSHFGVGVLGMVLYGMYVSTC